MMNALTQLEQEELTAYLDGELSASQARQVELKLAAEPAWQHARRQLDALGRAMDAYVAPAPADDLAARIVAAAAAHRQPATRTLKLVRWLAPVAAAAAVALAASLYWPWSSTGTNAATQADQLVIQNLDFFKNYDSVETISANASVVDDATLAAIEQMENQDGI